jgi:hypothetical protein
MQRAIIRRSTGGIPAAKIAINNGTTGISHLIETADRKRTSVVLIDVPYV